MELYETEYQICDHRTETKPLTSVRFNEAEKYSDHYLYSSYLELYLYKKVNKYLGISFDEFIDRSRHEIDSMVEHIDKIMQKEESLTSSLTQQLTAQTKTDK